MIQSEIAHIIKSQLEHQRLCILCTTGGQGMHAMPVRSLIYSFSAISLLRNPSQIQPIISTSRGVSFSVAPGIWTALYFFPFDNIPIKYSTYSTYST